jgi:RNA polymerase sigma-70 factor (ECF subfamily)
MEQDTLIPDLFKTQFKKIVAVLIKLFGLDHIEIAEDIVSETFLLAAETWGKKGLPENPQAWLYKVAQNKTKDYIKRNMLFHNKIVPDLNLASPSEEIKELDLSEQHIADSQLQMVFAVCHPSIAAEAQIGLALRILCGFGVEQIAEAFLTNKETINKRLFRAKEKLREEQIKIEFPHVTELPKRLSTVLTTLYLLFNEGYYSSSTKEILRRELCMEAMRLTLLLLSNESTKQPATHALMSLMCFHASRFDERIDESGSIVLYKDQDKTRWNQSLIQMGEYHLNLSATGDTLSKLHLEAAIAYWHSQTEESNEKWLEILKLYNLLLQIEYSPMAALNRTYALAQTDGVKKALVEAEKLPLKQFLMYYMLLGELYSQCDEKKAEVAFRKALNLSKTDNEKNIILKKLETLSALN